MILQVTLHIKRILLRGVPSPTPCPGFTCRGEFVVMLFCQLGCTHSPREMCRGLAGCAGKHARLGFTTQLFNRDLWAWLNDPSTGPPAVRGQNNSLFSGPPNLNSKAGGLNSRNAPNLPKLLENAGGRTMDLDYFVEQ